MGDYLNDTNRNIITWDDYKKLRDVEKGGKVHDNFFCNEELGEEGKEAKTKVQQRIAQEQREHKI